MKSEVAEEKIKNQKLTKEVEELQSMVSHQENEATKRRRHAVEIVHLHSQLEESRGREVAAEAAAKRLEAEKAELAQNVEDLQSAIFHNEIEVAQGREHADKNVGLRAKLEESRLNEAASQAEAERLKNGIARLQKVTSDLRQAKADVVSEDIRLLEQVQAPPPTTSGAVIGRICCSCGGKGQPNGDGFEGRARVYA